MKLTRRSFLQVLGSLAVLPAIGVAAISRQTESETFCISNYMTDDDAFHLPIYNGERFLYVIEDDELEFGFGTYDQETQTLHRLT